ncbi:MAG: peptidoglycan DD-metalloendopeptidase family protein [Candidatus Aminicenantia bacterium]
MKSESLSEKLPPSPPIKEHKEIIKRRLTITDILKRYEFPAPEIYKLTQEIKPVYNLAKIKAGNEIRIYTLPQRKFHSLEYDIDEENFLRVWKEKEIYRAEIKKLPFQTEVEIIHGVIENNLLNTVNKLGEKDILGLTLAELFGWDIDFYTDLRPGDEFTIIFEKKYLDGKFAKYGIILAAEFINQGKKFQAIRYVYPDTGEADYFTPEGKSLRKEFLKSPIKFGRITFRFSYSRFHPILKRYRPHYGVDYAAPIGTPVQATADGVVIFVGNNGEAGKMVKIRHKNNYETMYLHLSRYSKGIRKWAKVKQGQIIGYVGSSGLSTGSHLDYRIKFRGKYINPFAWRFKPVKPLRSEFLEDFKQKSQKYLFALEEISFPILQIIEQFMNKTNILEKNLNLITF